MVRENQAKLLSVSRSHFRVLCDYLAFCVTCVIFVPVPVSLLAVRAVNCRVDIMPDSEPARTTQDIYADFLYLILLETLASRLPSSPKSSRSSSSTTPPARPLNVKPKHENPTPSSSSSSSSSRPAPKSPRDCSRSPRRRRGC